MYLYGVLRVQGGVLGVQGAGCIYVLGVQGVSVWCIRSPGCIYMVY